MRRNYVWSRERILGENYLLKFHSMWAKSKNIPPFLVNIWHGAHFRISVTETRNSRLYIRHNMKNEFRETGCECVEGLGFGRNSFGSGYGQIPRYVGQSIEPSGWNLHIISTKIIMNSTIPCIITPKIVFQGGIVKCVSNPSFNYINQFHLQTLRFMSFHLGMVRLRNELEKDHSHYQPYMLRYFRGSHSVAHMTQSLDANASCFIEKLFEKL
jgi:hypothetical protein